ncbi:MAG: ATP-binding protein [Halothermotrichaceae bacterium]
MINFAIKSSFKKIIKSIMDFVKINIPDNYKRQFQEKIDKLNYHRIKFITGVLFLMGIIFVIIGIGYYYRILYIAFTLFMLICLCLFLLIRPGGRFFLVLKFIYQYIMPMILMVWGICLSFLDHHLIAYLITIFLISLILLIKPLKMFIIYLIPYVFFIILAPNYFSYRLLLSYYINISVMLIFGLIISNMFLKSKLKNYLNQQKIKDNNDKLKVINKKLAKRTAHIKSILNNAGQEFISFGKDLIIRQDYSSECKGIFFDDLNNTYFPDLLYPDNEEQRELIIKILKRVAGVEEEERDVYLSLFPDEISVNNKNLKIEVKIINNIEDLSYMVIITDITEKRTLENKMEEERRTLKMVVKAVVSYDDFFTCIREYRKFCKENIYNIIENSDNTEAALSKIFKRIHTFKGDFSQLNMLEAAERLHKFEEELHYLNKQGESISKSSLKNTFRKENMLDWIKKEFNLLKDVLGDQFFNKEGILMIESSKLVEIEKKMVQFLSQRECQVLIPELRKLRYKPFSNLLESYKDYLKKLSLKLEKPINPLVIEGGDMLVDPDVYCDFVKSLVHVFRNIMDHGIESTFERMVNEKEDEGNIACNVKENNSSIILKIKDDGAGIDSDKIKSTALKKGFINKTEYESITDKEAVMLIFKDKFTTRNEVSKLSGRGVGLAAVKNELDKLGGRVEVITQKNKGTTFEFTLPYNKIDSALDISPVKTMNYLVKRTKEYLISDLNVNFDIFKETKITFTEKLNLNYFTISIRVKGLIHYMFILSADEKFASTVFDNILIDNEMEYKEEYLIDSIAEVSNIILGNSIKMLFGDDEVVFMETPLTISSQIASICTESSIYKYELFSDRGNITLGLLELN